jgi:hypothetical protein
VDTGDPTQNYPAGPPDEAWFGDYHDNVETIEIGSASGSGTVDYYHNVLPPFNWTVQASQVVELFTGGKALRQSSSLFQLSQTLYNEEYNVDYDYDGWTTQIPPQDITLGALGNEGADGNLYAVLTKGQNVVITPQAPSTSNTGSSSSTSPPAADQRQNAATPPPKSTGWFGSSSLPSATSVTKTVYFSVDTAGEPGNFHPADVQKYLQQQLSLLVFDSPPPGHDVQVQVQEEAVLSRPLGWNVNDYVNRVTWVTSMGGCLLIATSKGA